MPLSKEQLMALIDRQVRITEPPPDRPELLNQVGIVRSITVKAIENRTRCLLELGDGSGFEIDVDRIQPA